MRWALVGGIIFVFFVAPWMFRSCTEAEGERLRNRMHQDIAEYRGRPVDALQKADDSWDW